MRRRPLSAAAKQHIKNIRALEEDIEDLEDKLRAVKESLAEEHSALGLALLRRLKIGDRMRRRFGVDADYILERVVGLPVDKGLPIVACYGRRIRKDGKPSTGGEQWIAHLSGAPEL